MLKHLSIKNFALIDHLEIDINEGLSIITGETGAGKSILLGALGLVLGERVDSTLLADKNDKCVIEATFWIEKYGLQEFFISHELDFEKSTIIRREITNQGKSRAFINDTPVTLTVLNELARCLIDIHSQHETLALNNHTYQLGIVDAFADNAKLLSDYKLNFNLLRQQELELRRLIETEGSVKAELDYFQFLHDELEKANLEKEEQVILEDELKLLTHTEEIKTNLFSATAVLENEEHSLLNELKIVKSIISKISSFHKDIENIDKRIGSVAVELEDIAYELSKLGDSISYNPDRQEQVSDRLDEIYRLQQKHKAASIDDLLIIQNDLNAKIAGISSLTESIASKSLEINLQKRKTLDLATGLSKRRTSVFVKLEKEISELLKQLGMENGSVKMNHVLLNEFTSNGIDEIEILFSANKGIDPKPISNVASGGELSRLMLSIKYILATYKALPTILFDEIDTGVSGEIADRMGKMMQTMSENMQVITITHLPQIAGKGQNHFVVYKDQKAAKTQTNIRRLVKDERITEIAKMLSGDKLSPAAYENARELLSAYSQ